MSFWDKEETVRHPKPQITTKDITELTEKLSAMPPYNVHTLEINQMIDLAERYGFVLLYPDYICDIRTYKIVVPTPRIRELIENVHNL